MTGVAARRAWPFLRPSNGHPADAAGEDRGDLDGQLEEEVSGIRRAPLSLRMTSRGMILGRHESIRRVLEIVDRVGRSTCTVLVTGESGTGKELAVAAIHDASERASQPLVTINCGAIPHDLVESELFGHVRGAFTGALHNRRGHIASADGGTLFLDEVGELPLAAQVKLLRVLQQREYTPLGESRAFRCDVRVVAATNRELASEVAAGRFREDLFYRLNVIHIALPPLRARGDDVCILAEHFYRGFVAEAARTDLHGLSEAALEAIATYDWPGNVRELENGIARAVLLAPGPYIEAESIFGEETTARATGSGPRGSTPTAPNDTSSNPAPPTVRAAPTAVPDGRLPAEGIVLSSCVERHQNSLIVQALIRTGGNKNKAARLLGLNRTTLVEMIRRRGL